MLDHHTHLSQKLPKDLRVTGVYYIWIRGEKRMSFTTLEDSAGNPHQLEWTPPVPAKK